MFARTLSIALFPLLVAATQAQTLTRVSLTSGLSSPIYAGSPTGDYDRIFIGEQSGRIRILRNGALLPTPFLTRSVLSGGERGLLGVAFHPDFATNGYVYINYTRSGDGGTMVSRFTVSSTNPDVVDPSSEAIMIGPIRQPFSNHNGGCIHFGPDGFLYVATGDGGSGGDPACNAQNGRSLLGKMLRLDVDQNPTGPAVAAAGNPFLSDPNFDDTIWSYGLRNPWRFSFDRETGDMWIGDVGQNSQEEVDFQPGTSTGGENYGWKIMEGTNCFGSSGCSSPPACNSAALVNPVRTLPTSSNCSVVGGYVYRGCAIPGLRGTYFHADYCSGRIYSFEFVNGQVTNLLDRTREVGGGGNLRSFGEDASGEILYVAGSSLYRIEPVGSLTNRIAGPGSLGSHGTIPIYEPCGLFGTGNIMSFRVRDGLPNASSAVLFSLTSTPQQLPLPGFGTLVAVPSLFSIPIVTDANGEAIYSLPAVGMPINAFHQVALVDVGLPGVTLTNALETFFYAGPPPTIRSVMPLSAAPGTTVTITGTNFAASATLTVAGQSVTPLTVSPQSITFAYPAGVSCDSMVVVNNPGGQSVGSPFNPTPNVTSMFPTSGPRAGGTLLVIVGSGFSTGSTVTIGGTAATITSVSTGAIVVTTPPASGPGAAPIVITSAGGCQTTSSFTYN